MKTADIAGAFAAPIDALRQRNAFADMQGAGTYQNALASLLGQQQKYNALAQHGGPTNAAAASLPTGDAAKRLTQKLIDRGLPQHVAQAFVVNFKDESGLNPGINEHTPLVPGSRGGYGLYQLTGPRRRQYEAWAGQNGFALDSEDAQLDFLMKELASTESAAAKSILSAPNTAAAAQAIVNKFLRPSEKHRASRASRYSRL